MEKLEKFKVLDGSALKLIAMLTMLIDHIGAVLGRYINAPLFTALGHTVDLYPVLRIIGRISFPIYAFLLVEGFLHTKNVKKYARDLLLLALISEIPWNLAHGGRLLYGVQNVMFTLLLGLLGIWVIRDLQDDRKKQALYLLGLLAAAILLRADYGCAGFGFILMLYLLRETPLYRAVVGACFFSGSWIAGLAFIPIGMYNGRRGFIQGKALKYAFYAFYPLHLFILYAIWKTTFPY